MQVHDRRSGSYNRRPRTSILGLGNLFDGGQNVYYGVGGPIQCSSERIIGGGIKVYYGGIEPI
ncbi:hypothetical protein PPO43_03730 [Saprospira sp. CCB-QB6]|uniref:hypothetical protein n=1 Tax=Saprospira sp. CCB-QB6 TaxID=3023936 RepID=UPI00234BF4DE|nr:hypothetical protein [Saprospira sp. CCB-QB6]WCL82213.1 hypothetical protein PPO43_03730 [Saprospira sp. CCB-QB6]